MFYIYSQKFFILMLVMSQNSVNGVEIKSKNGMIYIIIVYFNNQDNLLETI